MKRVQSNSYWDCWTTSCASCVGISDSVSVRSHSICCCNGSPLMTIVVV